MANSSEGQSENSTNGSASTTIRRRTNSWEKKNVIVYDVSSQRLSKEERGSVGGKIFCQSKRGSPHDRSAQHTRIEIPKRPKSSLRKDNVRISLPLRPDADSEFLAEVKLSSLGYKVQIERLRGNIE